MGVADQLKQVITDAIETLASSGVLPQDVIRQPNFTVERTKRADHGDLATNIAMVLQKAAKRPPREIAGAFKTELEKVGWISKVEMAGPGFLNVWLKPEAFHTVLREIEAQGRGYGRAPAATGQRVLLEFVSANPTGPLLISHGRNGILGDTIGRLLEARGNRVAREFYVNDFGNQVNLLALSVRAAHKKEPPPDQGYGAPYVTSLAEWIAANEPEVLADETQHDRLSKLCVTRMLEGIPGTELKGIKHTLASVGIQFDCWYSEESLHRWGRVAAVLARLKEQGNLIEVEGGALAFKMEGGEDEKDRIVRKSDGKTYTYFASDIAYHADKVSRGYDFLINVLGADHHGYVPRLRSALGAVGGNPDNFQVILYQLVSLLRNGEPVKMGKRLGNMITIDEVIEEIDEAAGRVGAGADALRYFYLSRRTETPIELDIEVAKKQSLDNPVFYLQYGYARLCAVLRKADSVLSLRVPRFTAEMATKLVHPNELAMLLLLGEFPGVVDEAARERAPHKIVFYLQDLSQQFQSYYTRLQAEKDTILPDKRLTSQPGWEQSWDKPKTLARLGWINAVRLVYKAGLDLLGIHAPESMERPPAVEGTDAALELDSD